MKDFILPGDTFAPAVRCGFGHGSQPTDWQNFGNAERLRVEFYEGRSFVASSFIRDGLLYREDFGPRWYAGPLWCRAGARKYRITYDETERQFYAERILPTSPDHKCISYEMGDHPLCLAK